MLPFQDRATADHAVGGPGGRDHEGYQAAAGCRSARDRCGPAQGQ